MSAAMTWEILWALILRFTLSAVVRAVVRREVLNLAFLTLAALLVWRFYSLGGRQMLSMMNGEPMDPGAGDMDMSARAMHG
jgi:ABC-type polysaccharide/polyol phosphate export permease